jgi:hypothetical protein
MTMIVCPNTSHVDFRIHAFCALAVGRCPLVHPFAAIIDVLRALECFFNHSRRKYFQSVLKVNNDISDENGTLRFSIRGRQGCCFSTTLVLPLTPLSMSSVLWNVSLTSLAGMTSRMS